MRALILFGVRGAEEIVAALIGIGREADRGEGFDLDPSTRSRRNSSSIDIDGNEFTETSSDFAARVWQHEFDHLEGILIIDKMSPIDRLRVRRALKDLKLSVDRID